MKPNRTKQYIEQMNRASFAANEEVRIDYPLGRQVSWTHGKHDRGGEVIDHGRNLSVKIRTIGQREVWIDVRRIHQ